MFNLMLEKLNPAAAQRIKPFLEEILSKYQEKIHSIYITGTSITDDFHIKSSDVNSIFVLKEMNIKFLKLIAPLGKKYGKNKVAAPLIMTPEYIKKSLDVFPIEFLNFKLIHAAAFGEDILENIEINRIDLRYQSERELKVKLIWLRQAYISSLGDRKVLMEKLVASIAGYIPLFRGIMILLNKQPPIRQNEVITTLSETANINTDVFTKALGAKREKIKFSPEEIDMVFEDYYIATEKLGNIIDEIKE